MSELLSQNLKRKHLSTSSSLSPSFSHIEKKIDFTTNSGTSNTSSMADHSESLGDPGILSQSLQSKIAMINQGKMHVPSTGLPSGPPPSFGFLGVGTGAGAPLTSTPAPTVGNHDQPGISDTDVLRIALTVKSLLSADLDKMVNEKVASLTSCMEVLSDENKKLRLQLDELEMYSRRSLVRIFGVAETKTDTDAAVMEIDNKIEVKLEAKDLAVSHRVGKVDPDGVKPRPIIARINNYAIRHELIKKSRDLRETEDMAEVSVNQELTKYRAKLAYECRKLVRLKKLKLTFIWDGKIFVIDKKENKRQIRSVDDLIDLYNTLGVPLNVASDG